MIFAIYVTFKKIKICFSSCTTAWAYFIKIRKPGNLIRAEVYTKMETIWANDFLALNSSSVRWG